MPRWYPLPACLMLALCLPACDPLIDHTSSSSPDASGGGTGDDIMPTAGPVSDGASNSGSAPAKLGPALQLNGRYFPDSAPWYQDVSSAPLSPESATITSWMVSDSGPNGWGSGGLMKVDFSIAAMDVPAGTPKRSYTAADGYYYTPDCDFAPVPIPKGGVVEQDYTSAPPLTGFSGYTCAGFDNGDDCHLLALSRSEHRLYEIYHATIDANNQFQGGCLAIWNLTDADTDGTGRGEQCTSADAAGFPIAALLFTPEEIKAGHIDHAIRFILPNSMIRAKQYVSPATHGTNTSGPAQAGPYGFRMRLRADYPLSKLTPAAQVVARAMQKYGMLLADGGNIALTAQNDVLSTVKWTDVGFDSHSLEALSATDFQVINFATPTAVTNNCNRNQITE